MGFSIPYDKADSADADGGGAWNANLPCELVMISGRRSALLVRKSIAIVCDIRCTDSSPVDTRASA